MRKKDPKSVGGSPGASRRGVIYYCGEWGRHEKKGDVENRHQERRKEMEGYGCCRETY